MKNFKNLTNKQLAVFEQIATGNDAAHNEKTLASLVKKGLITQHKIGFTNGMIAGFVYRYDVPLHHHMQWAAWCDDSVGD